VGRNTLEDLGLEGKIIFLEWFLRKCGGKVLMDASGSCEHGNEYSGSI